MGENTFRYSPAALRVRFSAAESDDRGARAPAASQASGGAAITGEGPAEPGAGATTALRGALAGARAALTGAGAGGGSGRPVQAAPAATYWRRRFIALA